MKALFTAGGTIAHDTGSQVSGGIFTITSPPSTKVKAGGNFVYSQSVSVTFVGGNAPGMVPGSVQGSGVIMATATKVFEIPSKAVMLDGDAGILNGTGQPSGGGSPVPIQIPCHCVASQTNVTGV